MRETVIDDARRLVIRLNPDQKIERVGDEITVRMVRLTFSLVRLTTIAELRGQDQKQANRTLVYKEWKSFPDWLQELATKHMPDVFHDHRAKKRADKLAAREAALRNATPHPDMIL